MPKRATLCDSWCNNCVHSHIGGGDVSQWGCLLGLCTDSFHGLWSSAATADSGKWSVWYWQMRDPSWTSENEDWQRVAPHYRHRKTELYKNVPCYEWMVRVMP